MTNDASGLEWRAGDYPSYNSSTGNTYFGNPAYVEIRNRPVFEGVSAETGVTFSFTYQPTKDKQYNQLLSFGLNEYNTNDARKRHLYVGATYHSTLGGNAPLYIDWIDGSKNVHLRAYPSGLTFSNNRTYDVIISISVAEGVVYIIDGVRYNTVYYGTSLENERQYITEFLNDIHNYQHNYIGRSRWTGDEAFTGNIRDLRLYGGVTTQTVFLSAPDADVEGTTVTAAAYGAAMPAITAPQRTGYTFVGYYDAVSGGTQYYNADGTSARVWDKTTAATLYARWQINSYAVSFSADGMGYTNTAPTATVDHGGSVSFTVTLAEGYTNSADPSVTATNSTVTSTKSGNVITYTVSDITAATAITVGAATINNYAVTFSADGTGYTNTTPAATVDHGGSVSFTVTLAEGYTKSADPSVTATVGPVTSEKDGNTITYTVNNITAATTITVGAATINT